MTKSRKAKPHTAKKHHHKKGGKKGGLKGTEELKKAKKGSMQAMAKPFGTIAGLFLSSLAGNGIDKIKFLAPDPAVTTFQVKSIIKPAMLLLAGAGTVFGTHGKNTPTMEFVNGLGWGFITGGTFNVVKVVLKKDPFSGLGKSDEALQAANDSEYYKQQMNEMAKVLEQNKFKVELPRLQSGASVDGITSLERTKQMNDTSMIL